MAESTTNAGIICGNPDCQVSETGKCVEGLETAKCPHFGHERADETVEAATSQEATAGEGIRLPGSDTLTTVDAARVLRSGEARVIAIVGPSDSGKTSLIASLYDLFQEGPVAEVEYARSLSLHAFEHTCHDARAASRRNIPHINRTPRGAVRFYHLDVGGGPAGEKLALVLGDRAGEEYRGAADDVSVVLAFPEVQRADTLTLLVDGERLLDSGARHNLRSEITMMLQALVDGGAVRTGQRLALVLTKIDLVEGSPHRARVAGDFDALFADMQRLFGATFPDIAQIRVAASPKTDTIVRGTGVPELLAFWLEPAMPLTTRAQPRPTFARAFAQVQPLAEREGDA